MSFNTSACSFSSAELTLRFGVCRVSRFEKATNAQIITRSRSGAPQPVVVSGNRAAAAIGTTGLGDQLVSGKATPEEIKEKMEQQLRMQRAAHQQKRALETLKNPANSTSPAAQLVKVTANSSHGKLTIHDDFGKKEIIR